MDLDQKESEDESEGNSMLLEPSESKYESATNMMSLVSKSKLLTPTKDSIATPETTPITHSNLKASNLVLINSPEKIN
jgi:hypothetical protein